MQQDHAAIVSLLLDPPQDDVRPGLCPILRVDILQHNKIIKVFRSFQRSQLGELRRARIRRVGWTKQCGGATCYRFKQELGCIQLKPDVLRPAEGKVWMIISVVPDLVPFINDATNKPRVTLGIYAHEEKRRFYVRRFENIQDLWRPSRIRAVVKSDCDLVLAAGALVI